MPKVTDEYLIGKRDFILECTNELLKEKPIYQIAMKDIIQKAGFSQGTIYRYYANIDEIYVDFINKKTTCDLLEQKIDALLGSDQPNKIIISECIIAIGEYIEELLKSVAGRTFFELLIIYTNDNEKRNTVLPQLKFKQSLEYSQDRIVEHLRNSIQQGKLYPKIPMDSIIMFICASVDGISQNISLGKIGNSNQSNRPELDAAEMFRTLAKALINFLEE